MMMAACQARGPPAAKNPRVEEASGEPEPTGEIGAHGGYQFRVR
jgi:hypothetical protein